MTSYLDILKKGLTAALSGNSLPEASNSLPETNSNSTATSDNSITTANGAASYSIGDHDPRVVFLTKAVRNVEEDYLKFLLNECWNVSKLDTLKLIFYTRDCRKGKGFKKIFDISIKWLLENEQYRTICNNLANIPFYGCWKDILRNFHNTELEKAALAYYAKSLLTNHSLIGTDKQRDIDIGLVKFAPGEGCTFDKKYKSVSKIVKILQFIGEYDEISASNSSNPSASNSTSASNSAAASNSSNTVLVTNKASYRKQLIRPLRNAVAENGAKIVEESMCSNEWDSIEYSKVPSVAMKTYAKTFGKHSKERFSAYITAAKEGKVKINTSVLTPVDIVGKYLEGIFSYSGISNIEKEDEFLEAQWVSMLKDNLEKRKTFDKPINILPIIDTSGSMFGCSGRSKGPTPIQVALSLGLVVSLLNDQDSIFYRNWVTFSSTPKFEKLQGDTLREMINNMDYKNWAQNTNFQAVFDQLLGMAVENNLHPDCMPKILLVISDMQFDCARGTAFDSARRESYGRENTTNWDAIGTKYIEAGYKRPIICFINVNGNSLDMPMPDSTVPDCCIIGGYNTNILDSIIDGDVPNPVAIMRKIIDNPRYDRVVV